VVDQKASGWTVATAKASQNENGVGSAHVVCVPAS
jgi:hypothetical protein